MSASAKAEARILVRAPRIAVFDALVDGRAMSRYWFTREDEALTAGQASTWAMGSEADALRFDVDVRELVRPARLVIDWDESRTMVWTLEDAGADTRLVVEEYGFRGSDDEIAAAVLDSTKGFNQVVVALKAWVEHGVSLNVVESHA